MTDDATAGQHPICAPIQHGDQTECLTCLKKWDTNDCASPQCPEAGEHYVVGKDRFSEQPVTVGQVLLFFGGYILGALSVALPRLL